MLLLLAIHHAPGWAAGGRDLFACGRVLPLMMPFKKLTSSSHQDFWCVIELIAGCGSSNIILIAT
jgi:hypothetical protein